MISAQSVGVRTNSMVPVAPRTTIESAGSSTVKRIPSTSSSARDAILSAFSTSSRIRQTPASPTTWKWFGSNSVRSQFFQTRSRGTS